MSNPCGKFDSNFVTDFIAGKTTPIEKVKREQTTIDYFENKPAKLEFSFETKAVFDAGRELWRYYHKRKNCNANASFYDIREYFQGRNDKGKMNSKSSDEIYNELIAKLRNASKILAKKIEPKVYEYRFLKAKTLKNVAVKLNIFCPHWR